MYILIHECVTLENRQRVWSAPPEEINRTIQSFVFYRVWVEKGGEKGGVCERRKKRRKEQFLGKFLYENFMVKGEGGEVFQFRFGKFARVRPSL